MDDGPKVRRVEEHFMGTPDGVMAPVDDLMDEIGSLDRAKEKEIDEHIISSAILGVDVMEVYSPGDMGLIAGSSLDLTNGWDLFETRAQTGGLEEGQGRGPVHHALYSAYFRN